MKFYLQQYLYPRTGNLGTFLLWVSVDCRYTIASFFEIFLISLKIILIILFFQCSYFRHYNVSNCARLTWLKVCLKSLLHSLISDWMLSLMIQGFFVNYSSFFEILWSDACSSIHVQIHSHVHACSSMHVHVSMFIMLLELADRLTWDRIFS